ncbi:MAG TPA: HEAT repeat domain-containing protein, partial [Candidatus Hydrogenedentes bacterium]|nr:HEAT repeat domain-containing protein [Candidatus Hydrogenedentota bacterium]
MIRRGFLPAGTAAFMTVLMVVCAAAAEAQPTVEDLLDRMPAETVQDMAAASEDLIGLGPEAIRAVCGMLVPPGEGDDVNARYLLSGLAKHVSPGDAEEARLMVSEAFLEALDAAEDPEVKAFLIRQVQVCGGSEAAGALRPYLDDDCLVEPAAQALLAIRGEAAAEALESAFEGAEGPRAVTLIQALGELRVTGTADQIVPFAASDDRDTRLVAYQALAEMGVAQALEPLRQAYESAGPYERAKVISYGLTYTRRLAEAGDTGTANAILDVLMMDEQASVRSAALATLVDIGSPSAQALLLAAMDDPSLEYRSAALNLAGNFPSVEATRQWIARMHDVSPEVRAEIIAMLGNRGDNTAAEVLARQILAEDKVVRMAAIPAATKLTGRRAVAPMLERLRAGAEEDEIEAIKTWLLQVPGRQLVKACAHALEQTPTEARIALLDVLKQRHAQTERRAIFTQARADDERVRVAALDALTTTAQPEDIPRVVELVIEAPSDAEKTAARGVLILLARESPRRLFNA